MSTLTCTVGGVSYLILKDGSFKVQTKVDTRAQYDFTLIDSANSALFSFGEAVTVSDSVAGPLFTGNILSAEMLDLVPQPVSRWKISATGKEYTADKRTSSDTKHQSYTGMNAGAIAVDMTQTYLVAEGVTTFAAERFETAQADFAQGTLSNVATNSVGDGDLELAPAGSTVTISQGPINFTATQAIKMTGTMYSPAQTNAYAFMKIWSGSYTIQSNDQFKYEMWIASTSPYQLAGVDFVCTDGTQFTFANFQSTADQQNILPYYNQQVPVPEPPTDLSGFATDTWYARVFQIGMAGPGTLAGKTIQTVSVALLGPKAGNYTAYFRNIRITNGGSTSVTFFSTSATSFQTTPQIVQNNGYSNQACSIVTTYDKSASIVSSSIPLSSAVLARSSYIAWTQPLTGNTLTVSASIDGGATYLPCTENSAIPGLLPGMSLSGINLLLKYTSALGSDPTISPNIASVTGNIQPSFVCSKSDITSTKSLQADWNAGTLTNLTAPSSNQLQLNGSARNWNDANFANQTLFGGANSSLYVQSGTLAIGGFPGTSKSRLDFAGTWQNFIAEVDFSLIDQTDSAGIIYRTTNWFNTDNSYAYVCRVFGTSITFIKGPNANSNSPTTLASFTFTQSLPINTWHHLKIVINGSSHQAYVDDVLYLNISDSTWTAAGNLGLELNIPGTSSQNCFFDNFGVCSVLSGTWVSPALDIHSLGTISGSELIVQADPNNGSTTAILAEISLNNGSTWATCNDARQTSLTSALSNGTIYTSLGVSPLQAAILSGTSLVIGYGSGTTQTVTLSSAAKIGDTLLNVSSFTASANFGIGVLIVPSSPASTSNALTVPGLTNGTNVSSITQMKIRITISTTSASTGAAMPDITGLTLLVMGAYSSSGSRNTLPLGIDNMVRANQSGWGTAFDGQSWTKTGTGTDAISSNEATITNTTGDVHEQLGSKTYTDTEGTVRFEISASTIQAGMELRYQDANDFYRLAVSTTAVSIIRVMGGVSTTLATVAATILTATFYRLRFRIVGPPGSCNLYGKVWLDGTLEPGVTNGIMSAVSPQWTVTATD